mgnify:CR=1 FL=1
MRLSLVSVVALGALLGCASASGVLAAPKVESKAESKIEEAPVATETFEIEGKAVTSEAFEKLRASLKGSYNWSCKKTTGGGVTSYEAEDASGQWYRVRQSSGSGPSRIEKIARPARLDKE